METIYLGMILTGIQVLRLWRLWIILAAFSLLWRLWPAMIFFTRVFDVVSWLWWLWCGLACIGIAAWMVERRKKR